MRIVLTHAYSWPEVRRGGERYLHELAAALAAVGHDASILSTARRASTGEMLGVEVRRFAVPTLGGAGVGGLPREVLFGVQALTHLIRRPPDVWHALGPADAAGAVLLGRQRAVRTVYTDLGLPWRWYWDRRRDGAIHRFVVQHVDRFVCLSGASATALASYGRHGVVVPGGVDTDRFRPASHRFHRPTLLFSGRLDEGRKQLGLLLRALAVLRSRQPDVELLLSGPGDPASTIAAAPLAARNAVRVLGVGDLDALISLYARSWATVLPSVHEAFGLVLVESLACGTPIVAIEGGGGPAELVEDGIGALGAATPEGLAEACERALRLVEDDAATDRCRAAGLRYDWRRCIVPRLEEVYQ